MKMNIKKYHVQKEGKYYQANKSCTEVFHSIRLKWELIITYIIFVKICSQQTISHLQRASSNHQEYPINPQLFAVQSK